MTPAPPARQLCPLCGHDDEVTTTRVGDEWVVTCASKTHPPMEWRPKEQYQSTGTYRTGIGEDLGVYDDLLACVHDGFAEYGVVEYRFAQYAPDTYRLLVDRYGHTALGPAGYSTSAFLRVPRRGPRAALEGGGGRRPLDISLRLLELQRRHQRLRGRRHAGGQ